MQLEHWLNYSNNHTCPWFVVVSMASICEISIHQAIPSENVCSHYNKVYANEPPMRLCNKHLISYTKKQLNIQTHIRKFASVHCEFWAHNS